MKMKKFIYSQCQYRNLKSAESKLKSNHLNERCCVSFFVTFVCFRVGVCSLNFVFVFLFFSVAFICLFLYSVTCDCYCLYVFLFCARLRHRNYLYKPNTFQVLNFHRIQFNEQISTSAKKTQTIALQMLSATTLLVHSTAPVTVVSKEMV